MDETAAPSGARLLLADVRWGLMTWVGLTVLTACMTILFLAMRALMDLGGACATGGPFAIETECPPGVGLSFPVSIWVGLVGLGLLIAGSVHLGGPRLWLLAWSALFLSLGWNFFEFGALRTGEAGTDWTSVLCAVLFGLLGAVPLWMLLGTRAGRREVFWSDSASGAARRRAARAARDVLMLSRAEPTPAAPAPASRHRAVRLDLPFPEQTTEPPPVDDGAPSPPLAPPSPSATTSTTAPPAVPSTVPAPPPDWDPALAERFVADLERLASLHERGALSDDEFESAKVRLLAGGRA